MKRLLLSIVVAIALRSAPAGAHPMGNFSVNRWTSLTFGSDRIELVHVVDLAEIPTQMELSRLDGPPEGERLEALRAGLVERTRAGLELSVNGRVRPLALSGSSLGFVPGAGGLPTTRLELLLRADVPAGASGADVVFRDRNFEGRVGWKEILAVAASGARLVSSDVPAQDRSRKLTDYPADPLVAPPDATEANLRVRFEGVAARVPPGAPAPALPIPSLSVAPLPPSPPPASAAVVPPKTDPASPVVPIREDRLTRLIHVGRLTPAMIVLALGAAFGLGALHALSPGHGKTVVAAYLVGSRGTPLQALLLGVVVTASHTAGVFALGAVTLTLSKSIVPERLFPVIELVSGLSIAIVGGTMLVRRLRGLAGDHGHGGMFGHSHVATVPEGTPTLAALLVLGASGGLLPCPSAIVVLLSAVALGRVAFGLLLIVAFSLGLATVLSAIGVLVVKASRLLAARESFGVWALRLPVLSALLVAILGLALSGKALRDVGLLRLPF